MSTETCWRLLRASPVARLAVNVGGHPDIFPVNFVVDGDSIVFRTGAGTKLAGAVLTGDVALEIDGEQDGGQTVWSVVVKGHAREIVNMHERYRVEELPLRPWVESEKPAFVRVEPNSVTGRHFRVVFEAAPGARHLSDHHPGAPTMSPD